MAFKDITTKQRNRWMDIAYSMVKDLINWKEVQRYIPNPLFLYSDKKKCQILLAIVDSTSIMGRKFNVDDQTQYEISQKYLDNFRFTRSLSYMKAYRKYFLLDTFNIIPDYDKLLSVMKYSFTDTHIAVNMANLDMISQLANKISNNANGVIIHEDDEDAQEKLTQLYTSSIVCNALVDFSERQNCNFMRCAINLVDFLFELQSLEMFVFEDDYGRFQKQMDGFAKLKILKSFGKLMDAILETATGICGVPHKTTVELNKELMKTIKSHEINIVDDDYDFALDFTLAYEDPCIIENVNG
jgi:hypothetical protein